MCSRKVQTVNAETQTVIRVFPHLLDEQYDVAHVSSDKKIQTLVSISAEQQNELFFSLLKFTPFRDIQQDSLKVVDIPRKVRLQFIPVAHTENFAEAARMFSLADDDGVGDICNDILHRLQKHHKPGLEDAAVQTDLTVFPNVLQDEEVANVYSDSHSQTTPNS